MNNELLKYGYTWVGMQEINIANARNLLKTNKCEVYKLYNDNTESLVENIEDMMNHCANGGRLGIEKTNQEIQNEVCFLYNQVGDLDMLNYLKNYFENTNDYKLKHYINNVLELNDKMLESDIYIEQRKELLNYMGYDYDEDGYLIYVGTDKVDSQDNYYYITFILGRDLLKGIMPKDNLFTYKLCKEIASDFIKSEYNDKTKDLYKCLNDYIKQYFYLQNGNITWKGEEI